MDQEISSSFRSSESVEEVLKLLRRTTRPEIPNFENGDFDTRKLKERVDDLMKPLETSSSIENCVRVVSYKGTPRHMKISFYFPERIVFSPSKPDFFGSKTTYNICSGRLEKSGYRSGECEQWIKENMDVLEEVFYLSRITYLINVSRRIWKLKEEQKEILKNMEK